MPESSYPVGIDLGTTYSCIGVWRSERVEIIADMQGNRTMPSVVAFTPSERLVGEAATNQAPDNVQNTVFGIKRMIGRAFSDAQLQEDTKAWPFTVRENNQRPVVEIELGGKRRQYSPEDISAMLLMKMKQMAELKLGAVRHAVITVPAYFDSSQRQATIDAGAIAGFNVLRILAEPTAAALAYGIKAKSSLKKNILVYDLGGGTFDASVLATDGKDFKVLATSGSTHLGGEDFDTRLVNHFVQIIRRKEGWDVSLCAKALRRLRTACERAKRTLSTSTTAAVEVDALYDGIDFESVISRAKFNELCADLFAATIPLVSRALEDAGVPRSQIAEVVLSGGSSRIPRVQQLLTEYFGGKELNTSISFDEAVACGAAIQAVMLKGSIQQRIRDIHLVGVTPLSLGVKVVDGTVPKAIRRNSVLPITTQFTRTTVFSYQRTVTFSIYEGESLFADRNLLLGSFVLENIESAPAGVPSFLVTMTIDLNGILHVSALDRVTEAFKDITIANYRGRLTKEEVQVKIEEAKHEAKVAPMLRKPRKCRQSQAGKIKSEATEERVKREGDNCHNLRPRKEIKYFK